MIWEGRLLLLFVIIIYVPSYYRHYEKCHAHQFTNRNLINSPQCADAALRVRYGPLQDAICRKATEEMRVSPWMCAVECVWNDLSNTFQESRWIFLVFLALAMILFARAAVQIYNRNADRRFFQTFYPPIGDEAPRRLIKHSQF